MITLLLVGGSFAAGVFVTKNGWFDLALAYAGALVQKVRDTLGV